ncbi:Glycyl-tRNA synthetase beta chain [hydrothermal vent metagenome]|uniref:glycine--tRNA ligase n=1 Tax=hydrothermal vent metagenome TaxID=652676 RepID=A0A3B0Z3T9_9ZZZZ
MSEKRDLLIEIGTEELPPKALRKLGLAFKKGIEQGLKKENVGYGHAVFYAAPRRLAVIIKHVIAMQEAKKQERRGPAITAAFNEEGMPSKAALGFARSCGVEVDQLEKLETKKGAWLVHRSIEAGKKTTTLIPEIIEQALANLPIPKRMRWGNGDVEFVRPVHWVVLLFGNTSIKTTILGVQTGSETYGHRFHHPGPLAITEPTAYAELLEAEGHVIADFATRRKIIHEQVLATAAELGGEAIIDEALLDEVTGLVEWPVALSGKFEFRFLTLPDAALISSMQEHQKYFPVKNKSGKLMPCFITVSNIDSKDKAAVRAGNERVIRPRLQDAMFFYEQDNRGSFEAWQEKLKEIVYQKQLGSLHDKTKRVEVLVESLATTLNVDESNKAYAARAAQLCKCDLVSNMVGEFPNLQGIMGKVYALAHNEATATAEAIEEHYFPRFSGGPLPQSVAGQLLAIAEKTDTICGIFHTGHIPSGDKDPFALRRAALGILRILVEGELKLSLSALIKIASEPFSHVVVDNKKSKQQKTETVQQRIQDFMMDRLKNYFLETDDKAKADTFAAVIAVGIDEPHDLAQRLNAVSAFRILEEAESLAAANKRIHNILRKANGELPQKVNSEQLEEGTERNLYNQILSLQKKITPLLATGQYEESLTCLAVMRPEVDRFFDEIMVMVDDPAIRNNRLALLTMLRELFSGVADISCLQG